MGVERDEHRHAYRLAIDLWEKHYKQDAPEWQPQIDMIGLLMQIDNMTAGMVRASEDASEVVAVNTRIEKLEAALRAVGVVQTCATCNGRGYVVEDSEWEPVAVQCSTCSPRS